MMVILTIVKTCRTPQVTPGITICRQLSRLMLENGMYLYPFDPLRLTFIGNRSSIFLVSRLISKWSSPAFRKSC